MDAKRIRLRIIYGATPHSCDQPCSRNRSGCNHSCNLLCHPGPCPPCEASEKVKCSCGKTEAFVKCGVQERNKEFIRRHNFFLENIFENSLPYLFQKSSNVTIFVTSCYLVEVIDVNQNVMIRTNHVHRVRTQLKSFVGADEVQKLSCVRTRTKFIRVKPFVESYWNVETIIAI